MCASSSSSPRSPAPRLAAGCGGYHSGTGDGGPAATAASAPTPRRPRRARSSPTTTAPARLGVYTAPALTRAAAAGMHLDSDVPRPDRGPQLRPAAVPDRPQRRPRPRHRRDRVEQRLRARRRRRLDGLAEEPRRPDAAVGAAVRQHRSARHHRHPGDRSRDPDDLPRRDDDPGRRHHRAPQGVRPRRRHRRRPRRLAGRPQRHDQRLRLDRAEPAQRDPAPGRPRLRRVRRPLRRLRQLPRLAD